MYIPIRSVLEGPPSDLDRSCRRRRRRRPHHQRSVDLPPWGAPPVVPSLHVLRSARSRLARYSEDHMNEQRSQKAGIDGGQWSNLQLWCEVIDATPDADGHCIIGDDASLDSGILCPKHLRADGHVGLGRSACLGARAASAALREHCSAHMPSFWSLGCIRVVCNRAVHETVGAWRKRRSSGASRPVIAPYRRVVGASRAERRPTRRHASTRSGFSGVELGVRLRLNLLLQTLAHTHALCGLHLW
jgi:hypothetical protein